VKRRVARGKIFDSPIVDVEKGDFPAYWTSSFGPEVCLQSVNEYVCSTFDEDKIFSSRRVIRYGVGSLENPTSLIASLSDVPHTLLANQ